MNQDSAARAERQPFDVVVLSQIRRHLNALADGPDLGIAHPRLLTSRDAAKYASSNDGDTRSTSAMLSNPLLSSSAGSSAVTSTFRPSKSRIAFGVLRPNSAMQRRSPRLRMRRRGFDRASLEPDDQPVDLGLFRSRHAVRRHHPATQLSYDFLPNLGMLRSVVDVHFVEQSTRRSLAFFVMAGDAVLIDERALRRELLCVSQPAGQNQATHSQHSAKLLICATCAPSVRYIAFGTKNQPEG